MSGPHPNNFKVSAMNKSELPIIWLPAIQNADTGYIMTFFTISNNVMAMLQGKMRSKSIQTTQLNVNMLK